MLALSIIIKILEIAMPAGCLVLVLLFKIEIGIQIAMFVNGVIVGFTVLPSALFVGLLFKEKYPAYVDIVISIFAIASFGLTGLIVFIYPDKDKNAFSFILACVLWGTCGVYLFDFITASTINTIQGRKKKAFLKTKK